MYPTNGDTWVLEDEISRYARNDMGGAWVPLFDYLVFEMASSW
jgi:hypothetical protein